MYNPGGEYLTYIKDSIIRKPRSKIVVDGKTYTGLEHLVSFPKITHETEKMIGGFPAKTCEFEIYNLDGKLNLNGKEVQIYRGLDVSDSKTVWVPMGLFYADGEDVTNNSTKRTIQFKGTDRTRLFDSPFANVYGNGIIPADTVISTVAEKICAKHGLSVNTATKANIISYRFTEAVGTPESTTDRQMISWIAELSGCIPIISRDGKTLLFTRPTYKETVTESGKAYPSGSYADKRKYKTLSAEPLYGPINAVSFGHADYDDAYVYQDDTNVQANGLHEWQINDNPLVENNKAALAPKVFAIIKGMKLYPFELTEFIDDYLFDINDGIQIKKKDGTHITSYVLGMSTTSRIRSTFKAGTQDSSAADRNLAGSVKADLKSVKLSVDHINNQITALVKDSDDKYTELKQTSEELSAKLIDTESGLEAKITATAEKAELTYAKIEYVDGQIEGVTDQISSINTQLDGIDGEIESKVTSEVQKDTTISILAGKVESKISGKYVTKATYDDEKQNWLLKTEYNSYVSQTDQKISAAVSRVQKLEDAEYITESQCSSLISAQADNIALSVESNLKYESRNLLMNSECFESLTPSGYHATYVSDYVAENQSYLPSAKARKLTFTADGTVAGIQFKAADTVGDKDKIKPNTTYALSFWARTYSENATQSLHWQETIYTALAPNVPSYDDKRTRGFKLSSSWQKVVIVFTTPAVIDTFTLRFALEGCVANQTYSIGISSIKLEVGNVATPWTARTPSVEEVEQYAKAELAMLPGKIAATVTDQYVADKIHSKCVSVTLDINGVTVENGALTLKDESGDVMIDSSGIHTEYLNFGKMINLDTIKNGTYFSTVPYGTAATKNIDIWTLRNYTGTDTGIKNAKAAVDVMSNIPELKPLFWNNSNNWFCSYGSNSADVNAVYAAKFDNIDETQTYFLTYDIILASVANGKGLLPQRVYLETDKSIYYEVGIDTLTSGSVTVSDTTYQYRYGTLTCSVRGYDLIKKKGGRGENAKLMIQIFSLGDVGTKQDSTSWWHAMRCPKATYMGFIGNIKLKTFVGATLNARALLNSNTDYFLDLGTGVLATDEISCNNLRVTAVPSVLSATDNLKPVYVDESTGQLYRLA